MIRVRVLELLPHLVRGRMWVSGYGLGLGFELPPHLPQRRRLMLRLLPRLLKLGGEARLLLLQTRGALLLRVRVRVRVRVRGGVRGRVSPLSPSSFLG